MQDINLNQLKLEIHDTYKSDGETTTTEAVNDEVILNIAYLDEKFLTIDGHISLLQKR